MFPPALLECFNAIHFFAIWADIDGLQLRIGAFTKCRALLAPNLSAFCAALHIESGCFAKLTLHFNYPPFSFSDLGCYNHPLPQRNRIIPIVVCCFWCRIAVISALPSFALCCSDTAPAPDEAPVRCPQQDRSASAPSHMARTGSPTGASPCD